MDVVLGFNLGSDLFQPFPFNNIVQENLAAVIIYHVHIGGANLTSPGISKSMLLY